MTTKLTCQCDETGVLHPSMASWYDPVSELPFVRHQPNQCKGTNELQLYQRGNKKLYLCSNCCLSSDKKIVSKTIRGTGN